MIMENTELQEMLLLFFRAFSQDNSAVEKLNEAVSKPDATLDEIRAALLLYTEERRRGIGQILSFSRKKCNLKNNKNKVKKKKYDYNSNNDFTRPYLKTGYAQVEVKKEISVEVKPVQENPPKIEIEKTN